MFDGLHKFCSLLAFSLTMGLQMEISLKSLAGSVAAVTETEEGAEAGAEPNIDGDAVAKLNLQMDKKCWTDC